MMQELKKYQISIFNETYTIVTDESEKTVNEAVNLVDSLIKETLNKSAGSDAKKIAIFVALKLASRMLSTESDCNRYKEKTNFIIQSIEKELAN